MNEVIKQLEANAEEAEKLKDEAEKEGDWSLCDYEEGYADAMRTAAHMIREANKQKVEVMKYCHTCHIQQPRANKICGNCAGPLSEGVSIK